MKRKIAVVLAMALAGVMLFSGVALASGPTPFEPVSVDIDWDGGGWVGATVVGGDDAITTFSTGGNHIQGTFTADYTAGSYDYMEVNTLASRLDASANGGGYIGYQTTRTDCYSGWCPSGQVSYSYVGTDDGNASMGTGSMSHLNGLIDYNYPLNGTLAVDSATNYTIIRSLSVGNTFAGVQAVGSGEATLQCQLSAINYQGAPGVADLGYYCAQSWSGRSFSAVGSGTFELRGEGDNSTTFNNTNMTGSTSGSLTWLGNTSFSGSTVTATDAGSGASLNLIANYVSSFDMGDYSIRAW